MQPFKFQCAADFSAILIPSPQVYSKFLIESSISAKRIYDSKDLLRYAIAFYLYKNTYYYNCFMQD